MESDYIETTIILSIPIIWFVGMYFVIKDLTKQDKQ